MPPTPPRSGAAPLCGRHKGMPHKGLPSPDPRATCFLELAREGRSLSCDRRRLCSWWHLHYSPPRATSAPPCLFPWMWHGPVSSAAPGESLIPPAEQRQNRAKFLGVNQTSEWTGRPRAAPRTARSCGGWSDTPTRFQGLPLALWRRDQLSWCRTLLTSEQVSPSAREHVHFLCSAKDGCKGNCRFEPSSSQTWGGQGTASGGDGVERVGGSGTLF